ncbi:MAG: arginine deiminase family protein [Bacteroidota bacterium]
MKIHISSETDQLQGVVVHTPGREVSLVNPQSMHELLFDDIIFENDARREHLDMLKVFKTAMPEDGQVLEIMDLALESFKSVEAREQYIERMIERFREDNIKTIRKELLKLDPKELLEFVVTGTTDAIKGFNLHPSPNLLFTRDLAVVVNDSIILSNAARKARVRESLLMEIIVQYHPLFETVRDNAIRINEQETIEGGDVLVASEDLVMIGMSERTSFSGIMNATEGLLDHGVQTVLAVDIPKQRSSMHLDTIFTFASPNECIAFPPAIMERKDNVVALSRENGKIITEGKSSLKSAMEEYLGREMTFINCGGDNRNDQFREQWTDGANVFALAPGLIVGYERNTNTFRTLQDHGFSVMKQEAFIEEYSDKAFTPGQDKVAVSFRGHELCRGRGGARCMTMPISRKS